RDAVRRRTEATDRRSDAGRTGDLVSPPAAAREDRHPSRGARRAAAEDGRPKRPRPARRRPPHRDLDVEGRASELTGGPRLLPGVRLPESGDRQLLLALRRLARQG